MALPPVIEAMLDPGFYRPRPATVELRQTHISYVLLAGDAVYKVKKPVRFTFLDFASLERRRFFCHEEVRLNRRLAPGVYRGVVGLRPDGDGFALTSEDDAAAVEYAVHMRRLDDESTLAHRLAAAPGSEPRPLAGAIDSLATLLVEFHRLAAGGPEVAAHGDAAAIRRVLQDNFDGVRPFRGVTIAPEDDDAIQEFTRRFLADQAELLRRRQADGRIREGHGDLRADHVYLTAPPVIVDCVEFSERFRCCDVASDLAFLAMDLESRGRADLARRLIAAYADLAGDPELPALVPFYSCYRAYVRGKVDSLTSAEDEVAEAERAGARRGAARHFALALRYTWAYARRLVVVSGLSGTGKSTVAQRLAERTGFALLSTDVVRKELAGIPATARLDGALRDRLYSAEMSRRTYAELLERAAAALERSGSVILDGTFQVRAGRDEARALAAAHGARFALVACECPEDVVRRRLEERARRGDDPSDADWAVFREQQRRFEPFTAEEGEIAVDTGGDLLAAVRAIEAALR